MRTYVCVYAYVSVYHECEPGLPTEGKSTIQDYIYRDTVGNPLYVGSLGIHNLEHVQRRAARCG